MKTDLATSILAATIGVVVAYVICNLFLPPLENVSFSTLTNSGTYELTEPSDEVFNFRALNPTVEVYVGECSEYDENGKCKDDISAASTEEEETTEETENTDNAPTTDQNPFTEEAGAN